MINAAFAWISRTASQTSVKSSLGKIGVTGVLLWMLFYFGDRAFTLFSDTVKKQTTIMQQQAKSQGTTVEILRSIAEDTRRNVDEAQNHTSELRAVKETFQAIRERNHDK